MMRNCPTGSFFLALLWGLGVSMAAHAETPPTPAVEAAAAESRKLAGLVDGSIEAKTLVIHASARITGDVTYENVTIEQGAHVDGKLTHRRAGVAKPAIGVVGGESQLAV